MNRRTFLQASFATSTSAVFFRHATAKEAPTVAVPGPESGIYPIVPGVTHAWSTVFSKSNKATILAEPVALFFWAFAFNDESAARDGFNTIAYFYHDYIEKDATYPVTETSIGKIGDERRAYFDDSAATQIAAAIRVGSVVQASMALAFGGDLPTYMAQLLSGALPADDSDPSAFIPDISSLPPGWETTFAEPMDITAYASGATPAPTPQPTPSPTPVAAELDTYTGKFSLTIDIVDFAFVPNSVTIPAGVPVRLNIQNGGAVPHTFFIDAIKFVTDPIPPGDGLAPVVNIEEGTYQFYCSEPGHKDKGMVGTLVALPYGSN